jgi:hypothetical protein
MKTKLVRIFGLMAPIMLQAGTALALNSVEFPKLAIVAQGWENIVTGPFAVLLIATGGAVAAVAWIFSRSLMVAFETGAGLIGGGVFVAFIASLISGLFGITGALIR